MKSINTFKWAAAIGCACSGVLLAPAGALVSDRDHPVFLGEVSGGGGKGREELKKP